tara:strand:- start:3738 stop:4184 length:447 start_codon:yes stop_codon:yes gene_type:complete
MQFEHFKHPDTSFYTPKCVESELSMTISSDFQRDFLSTTNISQLQQMIIHQVFVQSGGKIKIHEQDTVSLGVIMRDVYDRYKRNDLIFLNNKIVEMSSNIIIGNVLEYVNYRNKITDTVSLNSSDWQNVIHHPVRPDEESKELFYELR